jgi:hypothetical protein
MEAQMDKDNPVSQVVSQPALSLTTTSTTAPPPTNMTFLISAEEPGRIRITEALYQQSSSSFTTVPSEIFFIFYRLFVPFGVSHYSFIIPFLSLSLPRKEGIKGKIFVHYDHDSNYITLI